MLGVQPRAAPSSSRRAVRVARYAAPHWRAFVVLAVTMLSEIALNLAKPWPLKLVIDNVLGHQPTPRLLTSLLPGSSSPHGLLLWAACGSVAVFVLATASSTAYS